MTIMTTEPVTVNSWAMARPNAAPYEIDWTRASVPTRMEDWATLRENLHELQLLFDGEMVAAADAKDQHTAAWNAICAHHAEQLVDAIGNLFHGFLPAVD